MTVRIHIETIAVITAVQYVKIKFVSSHAVTTQNVALAKNALTMCALWKVIFGVLATMIARLVTIATAEIGLGATMFVWVLSAQEMKTLVD